MVPAERDRLLDGVLYKHNYGQTAIAFRDGAGDVLRSLAGTHTHVVTNSHTDAVQQKITVLGGETGDLDWLVRRVHGRARKYILDDAWTAVGESMQLPGLERPVLLRRRLYHAPSGTASALWCRLAGCRRRGRHLRTGPRPAPGRRARVGLLVNDFTPAWEQDYLADHPRGALLHDVSEIPAFAGLADTEPDA